MRATLSPGWAFFLVSISLCLSSSPSPSPTGSSSHPQHQIVNQRLRSRQQQQQLRSGRSGFGDRGPSSSSSSVCSDPLPVKKRIVCYYRVEENFRPYDLDPCLCTHVIYSYVAVKDNLAFIAGKKGDLKFLSNLKSQNPTLKVLVSLRPADKSFSLDPSTNSSSSSSSSQSSSSIKHKFSKRVKDFLSRHDLDGIDLDWEFFRKVDKSSQSRGSLVSLLRVVKSYLNPSSVISVTSSKYPRDLTESYDLSALSRFVDFVNVPAFSFDSTGKTVRHPARLHGISDMENMDSLLDLVLALGLPHDQVTVGVPAHGILYKLANVSQTTPGSPSIPYNYNDAIISHSKICAVRDGSNWTMIREKDLTSPYIYNKDKWIGFDDEISIKLKAKYVILRNLGGLTVWSPNDDDPAGKCGYGPFPLLQAIKQVMVRHESINNRTFIGHITNSTSSKKSHQQSFVAVIEKYGNVERVTDEELGEVPINLPCTKVGHYMKHPKDCSRFYRCINMPDGDGSGLSGNHMTKFQYGCPPGLIFDETYEVCNWPSWSTSCAGSGEILQAPKAKFGCPSYGYFQDPNDCQYFYYCSDFGSSVTVSNHRYQPYEFKCPFDLAFDEEKLLCNWKWLVKGCKEWSSQPADSTEPTNGFNHLLESGSISSASQGIGGEPDELLEKRSDDVDDIEFVDTPETAEHRESPPPTPTVTFTKSEGGRRNFARALKDAVSDAIENVSTRVKSALGYSPEAETTKAASSPAPGQSTTVAPSTDKMSKRQDIIDPVFIAEESIISNLFAGINPIFNPIVDKVKERKSSIRDHMSPGKLSGKDHFISIPIIEVAGAARNAARNKGRNKKGKTTVRPLSSMDEYKLLEQLVASSLPPSRGYYTPQPARSRGPTDRPRKSQITSQASSQESLIPVPILTIRETPRPDRRPDDRHLERRPDGPGLISPKPKPRRPHPPPHSIPRSRPEPEPVKDGHRRPPRPLAEPEPNKQTNRHQPRPQEQTHNHQRPRPKPTQELRTEASGHNQHRIDHRIRHPRPEPVRQSSSGHHHKPPPPPVVDGHNHHPQALPSVATHYREPAPRVPHVHHPKNVAPPASSRPKKQPRPTTPKVPRIPSAIPVHPSIGSIQAQLPPELFANYDIDIKPLSVHPILSPSGNLDFAQLQLVPLPQPGQEGPTLIEHHLLSSTRKPGKLFGMPAAPGSRPSAKRPKDKNRPPTVHPKNIPHHPPPPKIHRKPVVASGPPPVPYHHPSHQPAQVVHHHLPRPQTLEVHEINLDPAPQNTRHHQDRLTYDVHPPHDHHQEAPAQHHQVVHPQPQQPSAHVSYQPTHQVYGPQPQEVHHQVNHVVHHQHQPQPPAAPAPPQPPQQPAPTVSPQHPSYGAHYQPQASGSHHSYHSQVPAPVGHGLDKLAPTLGHDYNSLNSITKNGFKPIVPNGFVGVTSSYPVHSYQQPSHQPQSHYQYSVPSGNFGSRLTPGLASSTPSPITYIESTNASQNAAKAALFNLLFNSVTTETPCPPSATTNQTLALPSSTVVTISSTVAPSTAAPTTTSTPAPSTAASTTAPPTIYFSAEVSTLQPTTIQVKEVERITTKFFKPSSAPPGPVEIVKADVTTPSPATTTPAASEVPQPPQIQVYIVQGPNGPQVQAKTVNGPKDGSKSPNVQVYVIDEQNKDREIYTPTSGGYGTRVNSNQPSHGQGAYYYQYDSASESQVKYQTTLAPMDQGVDNSGDNLYYTNNFQDLEYEDDGDIGPTYPTVTSPVSFLPSSKIQSLQSIYSTNQYPGLRNFTDGSVPEVACSRPGLFQHPNDCNKFYECYFDRFVNKYTLHLFECPVKLAFDSRIVGCSGPADPTVCVQY